MDFIFVVYNVLCHNILYFPDNKRILQLKKTFMPDEILSVNDIVTKHAAENPPQKESGDQSSQQENNGEKDKGSEDSAEVAAKLEADKKVIEDAAKLEAEKSKGTGAAPTEKKEGEQDKPDQLAELLKEFKFENLDALKEAIKKKDEEAAKETPEQKKRAEELYKANLQTFAVENGVMALDDFQKLETLKSKADKDLVFERYASEVRDEITDDLKEENPDVKPEDIDAKIKEAFEKEYPLESKNKKAKERAEKKIANEAKSMRSPLESSFNDVKSRYDEEREVSNAFPKYAEKLNELIGANITPELTVYSGKDGEEEVSVKVPLTEEERKAVVDKAFKKVSTHEMYKLYKAGKVDEISALVKDEVDAIMWKDYREKGLNEIAKEFLTRGTKKGSTTGAKNPFPVNQANPSATEKRTASDKQQEVLDSLEGKK
jgi:hypothetical protein